MTNITPETPDVKTTTIEPDKKPKRKVNYLNNKDMLAELIKSKADKKLSNTLSKMIMMLTKRYAQHPWFINYTYNDDMQSFALLTVVKMWDNFNPEKGSNAFAYFTQIIKRAFYQYKIQEKKHRNIRDMLLVEQGEMPSYTFANEFDADNLAFERMDNFERDEEYKAFDRELSVMEGEVINIDPTAIAEKPETPEVAELQLEKVIIDDE